MNCYTLFPNGRFTLGISYSKIENEGLEISLPDGEGGGITISLPADHCVVIENKVLALEKKKGWHLLFLDPPLTGVRYFTAIRGDVIPLGSIEGSRYGEVTGFFLVRNPGQCIVTLWDGDNNTHREIMLNSRPGGDLGPTNGNPAPILLC